MPSGRQDLNLRPLDPQSSPHVRRTEPLARGGNTWSARRTSSCSTEVTFNLLVQVIRSPRLHARYVCRCKLGLASLPRHTSPSRTRSTILHRAGAASSEVVYEFLAGERRGAVT